MSSYSLELDLSRLNDVSKSRLERSSSDLAVHTEVILGIKFIKKYQESVDVFLLEEFSAVLLSHRASIDDSRGVRDIFGYFGVKPASNVFMNFLSLFV